MSSDKPNKQRDEAPHPVPPTQTHRAQYPEALPASYDPQQQPYPQYYNNGSGVPQGQQQYYPPQSGPYPPYQQPLQLPHGNLTPGQGNSDAPPPLYQLQQLAYVAPVNPQSSAPAEPAYFDYTVPQSFDDVGKPQGSGEWETSMWKAPCADPCFCISAFFCPCCCAVMQRRKLLLGDWSRYQCCAGLCGSCWCLGSNCGSCAPFCMVMESVFCLACAVHGNRFMVMQHYGLQTECCDCVLMWAACVLKLIGIILGNDWIQSAADCLYLVILSCLLTQNEYQMKTHSYPAGTAMT